MIRPPPISPLFPYTTLSRSLGTRCSVRRLPPHTGITSTGADEPLPVWIAFVRELAGSTRGRRRLRSEEHTSELQSHVNLVCRLLLEKKKKEITRQVVRRLVL